MSVHTVKRLHLAIINLILVSCLAVAAQEPPKPADDWLHAASAIAEEYLDPAFIDALNQGDRDTLERFLDQLSRDFGSECVLDLADLEETATTALQIMDKYEETAPYAAWLKPRLDYFRVAKRLKAITAAPKGSTPKVPPGLTVPSAAREREVWGEQIKNEPVPERARTHLAQCKEIFREQKVPPELVWIAEVESSFNPAARSPTGAAGMFQIMPATAKRFGLSRFPFDERYRPVPSATAAAKYLRYLHRKFGDWRLALAAYNCGEGTVERLLHKPSSKGFDAIAAELPAETQLYVPKVEAVLLKREGVNLQALAAPLQGH